MTRTVQTTSHYGRKAFGPGRKRSDAALAKDIAASIRNFWARGEARDVRQYTDKDAMIAMVEALLSAEE